MYMYNKVFFIAALVVWGGLSEAQTKKANPQNAAPSAQKSAAGSLSLEDFLSQVREQNKTYKGAELAVEGAKLKMDEWRLKTQPSLFGDFSYAHDQTQRMMPLFNGRESKINNYSLGLQMMSDFGLTGKLYYNYVRTQTLGLPVGSPMPYPDAHVGNTRLELSQSLWRNFAGKEIQAIQEQLRAQAEFDYYQAIANAVVLKSGAETVYWKLALAREQVGIAKDNLDRGQKLNNWSDRRVRSGLADRADGLQAEANLLAQQFAYQSALDAVKIAARQFNLTRGVQSDEVPESLDFFDSRHVENLVVPEEFAPRPSLKLAELNMRLAKARFKAGAEANKPVVDVYANLGLNGLDKEQQIAVERSFSTTYPFTQYGLRISIPLNFGLSSDVREGYAKAASGADMSFNQANFEEQAQWNDAIKQFNEAKNRLIVASKMEAAQKAKLDYERNRLERGRTTTDRVIMFENDYANAHLNKLNAQNLILNLYTQIKTYGGSL